MPFTRLNEYLFSRVLFARSGPTPLILRTTNLQSFLTFQSTTICTFNLQPAGANDLSTISRARQPQRCRNFLNNTTTTPPSPKLNNKRGKLSSLDGLCACSAYSREARSEGPRKRKRTRKRPTSCCIVANLRACLTTATSSSNNKKGALFLN